MYKGCWNMKVISKWDKEKNMLHIYLIASGVTSYYVMSHRFILPIHCLLKDGIDLGRFARWNGRSPIRGVLDGYVKCGKLGHYVKHLLEVVDSVLIEEGLINGGEDCA